MSNNHKEKLISDSGDKVEDFECVDSGFMSSSNILYSSGDIQIDEEDCPSQERGHSSSNLSEKTEEPMRLDSGIVCLSENFSSLCLQNPNLNNLSGKIKSKCSQKIQDIDADPWKIYFEQDTDGDTHLHLAVKHGLLDAALALIQLVPHPMLLDTPNDKAETPLHRAVKYGHWQVVRWLIVAGARPSPRNLSGDSPLHIASRLGDARCCKALTNPVQMQERQDLNLKYKLQPYEVLDFEQWNYDGQTCVHLAAINGNIDVLRHLVWYGADINAREGKTGFTALHYSVIRQDEQLVHFLINECKKLDVDTLSYGGRSPLQINVPVKSTLSSLLIRKGVEPAFSDDSESDMSDSEYEEESDENLFAPSNLVNPV